MKIEFVKETKVNGSVIWYTQINDEFVDNSLVLNEKEGRGIYQKICAGHVKKIEILETFEID